MPYTVTPHASGGSHLMFVPVDGRLVFAVCGLLVLFVLVDFVQRCRDGQREDDE